METVIIVMAVILFLISAASFVTAYFQFHEKGFLLNNAYLYASDEERRRMDKKPFYRQSAIVFTFIGVAFLLNGLELILKTGWLFYVVLLALLIAIVYAIVSSVRKKR